MQKGCPKWWARCNYQAASHGKLYRHAQDACRVRKIHHIASDYGNKGVWLGSRAASRKKSRWLHWRGWHPGLLLGATNTN